MSIRVLLVDDHEIVRQGIRSLIGTILDIELVGEAENGQRAVELALETNPDVIIMDIGLPDISGIEATEQIISENPEAKVLALSMHSDRQYVKGFFDAGGKGYVCKDDAFGELDQAIRAVYVDQPYLSKSVTA
jgi:DNA-binding NarL/FixJ family response regulator